MNLIRLYCSNDIARDEWVLSIRQHAVHTDISNGYSLPPIALDVDVAASDTSRDAGLLGQGSFGSVYLCRDRVTDKEWACKVVKKTKVSRSALKDLENEVRVIQKVGSHANIVFLKEFVETHKHFYLIMQVCSGGDLFDYVVVQPESHFTEHVAADLMFQMVAATSYLHSLHIAHRDFKPENFLVHAISAGEDKSENGTCHVKMCDFGLAAFNVTSPTALTTFCGTPGYLAPEIIEGLPYGVACDVWSLGVIMYVLLTGTHPFLAETDAESHRLTVEGAYDVAYLQRRFSPATADLTCRLLTSDPAERISACDALEHAWLSSPRTSAGVALSGVQANIRQFRAKQCLRRAMNATLASVRMQNLLRHLPGKATSV